MEYIDVFIANVSSYFSPFFYFFPIGPCSGSIWTEPIQHDCPTTASNLNCWTKGRGFALFDHISMLQNLTISCCHVMGFNILLLLRMIIFCCFRKKKINRFYHRWIDKHWDVLFLIDLDLPCFLDSVDLSPLELLYFFSPRIDHSLQMNVCILIKMLLKLKWLFWIYLTTHSPAYFFKAVI